MINIIFTLKLAEHLTDEQTAQFMQAGCIWVSPLPEMRYIDGIMPIQVLIPDEVILSNLKPILDAIDLRGSVEIVGAWDTEKVITDESGNAISCAKHSAYSFDFLLYQQLLNDIVTYDADGVIISSHRPSQEEALVTQVNRYAGMLERDISF